MRCTPWVTRRSSISAWERYPLSPKSFPKSRFTSLGTGRPLVLFPSHGPHSFAQIDVDHPYRNPYFNHGNAYLQQAIPERISIGQNTSDLQKSHRDMKDRAAKGTQREPEAQRQWRTTPRMSRAINAIMPTRNSITGTGYRSAKEDVSESDDA